MYNPSLREQPRYKMADVIPVRQESSLIVWLENTGRMIARDALDQDYLEEEAAEFSELMSAEEGTFDIEEDDDDDEIAIDIV
ncbi:MAG TPA: DUF3134 domain-containing protein [Halomicronema sp.]|jgi:hypothetical protein